MEITFTDSMEKALFRQYRHCLGHMENCLLLYFHLILVSVYVQWTRTKADGRLRVGGYPGNEGWSDQFLQSLNSLQHTFFPSRYFSEFLSFTLSTGLRRALTCSSSWISKLLILATDGRSRRLKGRESRLQRSRTARMSTSWGALIESLITYTRVTQLWPNKKRKNWFPDSWGIIAPCLSIK